jgi:hypothetical protein
MLGGMRTEPLRKPSQDLNGRAVLAGALMGLGLISTMGAPRTAAAADGELAATGFAMPDLASSNLVWLEVGGLFVREGDRIDPDDFAVVTSVLGLQLSPLRGLTVFGALPSAQLHGGESQIDTGNVSLGARYARRSGSFSYGGSVAVFLPTSPELDGFGSADGGAVFSAMLLQPERLAAFAPDVRSYRGGLDLRRQSATTFLQGELAYQRSRGPFINLHLLTLATAAGVAVSPGWWLVGQLDTTSLAVDRQPWHEDRWLLTASAGSRYQAGALSLGARLYLPLDTFAQDDLRSAGLFFDVASRF